MKYCPICEKTYGDEVRVCELDGGTLIEAGSKQDPFIGRIVKGRYRVIKKLGEGGMGTVYLAEQVSIGRSVALKVLHGKFAQDEEFVKRFRQEARLEASLNHRNVITVYDFDQADDGSLFIAMEYVDGRSLKEAILEGPLVIGSAVRLGIQIGEGLGVAHRAGVIHRDIKPENIMVVGRLEEVKLMDFGIARLRDTGTTIPLTRAGMVMGTPAYMSPEQIEGGEISERTDIYAFGIVLYEMLSGVVPFRASTPGSVLAKHLQEIPVPLRRLRREVPSPVERVVMQALEKKPERRQKNMDEVVEQLKKGEGKEAGTPKSWVASRQKKAHLETQQIPKTWVAKKEEAPLGTEQMPKTWVATQPLGVQRVPRRRLVNWKLVGVGTFLAAIGIAGIIGVRMYVGRLGPQTNIVSLVIYSEKRVLTPKGRTVLRARAQYSDGSKGEITQGLEWQSNNPSVATVTPGGEVEGQKRGKAVITVRYAGVMSRPLTLTVARASPVLMSLTVVSDKRELKVKQRAMLRVKGKYSDGREAEIYRGVEWQTSDDQIASVDSTGRVTARKSGYVDLTARYKELESPPLTLLVKAKPPEIRDGGVNQHIKLAKRYLGQGRFQAAIAELERAKAIDPSKRDVRALLEKAKAEKEAAEKAVTLMKTGLAYLGQGRYSEAISQLKRAKAIHPKNKEVEAILIRAQRARDAETSLKSKGPLRIGDIETLLSKRVTPMRATSLIEKRGVIFQLSPAAMKRLRRAGANDQVIVAIQKKALQYKRKTEKHIEATKSYLDQGKYAEAIAETEKARALGSEDKEALAILEGARRARDAEMSLQSNKPLSLKDIHGLLITRVTPKRVASLVAERDVNFDTLTKNGEKKLKEAGADHQVIVAIKERTLPRRPAERDTIRSPGIEEVREVNKGKQLIRQKRYQEAFKSAELALKINPRYKDVWVLRGDALRGLKHYQEAVKSYDRAIAINDRDALIWSKKALALQDLSRHKEAVLSFDRALDVDPTSWQSWVLKGDSLRAMKRCDEARRSYDRALGINPSSHLTVEQRYKLLKQC